MRCSCGMIRQNVNNKCHLASVFHRQGQRILALKAKECLTLKEIGKRVGVSRERVRQIFKEIDPRYAGFNRRHICVIGSRETDFESNPYYEMTRRVRNECRQREYLFETIQTSDGKINQTRVIVEGLLCQIRKSSWSMKASQRYFHLQAVQPYVKYAYAIDIFLISADDLGWLVIPREEYTSRGTFFVLGRPFGKIGFKGSVDPIKRREARGHKNWSQYLNAWHLIGEASLRKKMTPALSTF